MQTYTYNYDGVTATDENGQIVNISGKPSIVKNGIIYVFETESERKEYYENNAAPIEWSKESYAVEVNEAHNALFTQYYTERNYLTIGEIPHWWGDDTYGEEAHALTDWWRETCKTVADYLEDVSEETAIDVETFINSLPKLND